MKNQKKKRKKTQLKKKMDNWSLSSVGKLKGQFKKFVYVHRENPAVEFVALRDSAWSRRHEEKDCVFNFYFMVEGNSIHWFMNEEAMRKKDFEAFIQRAMEDTAAATDQVLAFAANVKIEIIGMSACAVYECGVCGKQRTDVTIDPIYDHFVKKHFSGHSIKGAGRG